MKEDIQSYNIRQLDISDLESYKRLRLEALLLEPSVFSSTYEREAAFSVADWEDRLNQLQSASFGLFHDERMIGITGILIPDVGQEEAILVASYIQKPHRGKGLSALLYRQRIEWARKRGLKRIIVSHRKSNEASRAANQRSGFRFTHEEQAIWPDGIEEANVFYRLDL
ncbi:GNAT family N-acetyltransferase [Taibaiella koreensis]|uniref:GNAT family N-acetyltransferase n=1 Tax=Taibaiella koreensis TaxID=1268548 RepID=UPI000E5A00A7|nr:GNAT family N-acetyltransferase [Taibaiella koreensis]